eukprot:gene10604-biopygen8673
MESGPLADWSAQTMVTAEARVLALAENAGCLYQNSSEAVRCLRSKSAAEIMQAEEMGDRSRALQEFNVLILVGCWGLLGVAGAVPWVASGIS